MFVSFYPIARLLHNSRACVDWLLAGSHLAEDILPS